MLPFPPFVQGNEIYSMYVYITAQRITLGGSFYSPLLGQFPSGRLLLASLFEKTNILYSPISSMKSKGAVLPICAVETVHCA